MSTDETGKPSKRKWLALLLIIIAVSGAFGIFYVNLRLAPTQVPSSTPTLSATPSQYSSITPSATAPLPTEPPQSSGSSDTTPPPSSPTATNIAPTSKPSPTPTPLSSSTTTPSPTQTTSLTPTTTPSPTQTTSPAPSPTQTSTPNQNVWTDGRIDIALSSAEQFDNSSTFKSFFPGTSIPTQIEGRKFILFNLTIVQIRNLHVVDLIEKNDETTKMYDKTGNEYSFGAAMATGIQYSDPNNFTSNSEYVVGARILLVFDMPKQENPRNLSVVYLFKETWEASEQISRVNIVF